MTKQEMIEEYQGTLRDIKELQNIEEGVADNEPIQFIFGIKSGSFEGFFEIKNMLENEEFFAAIVETIAKHTGFSPKELV